MTIFNNSHLEQSTPPVRAAIEYMRDVTIELTPDEFTSIYEAFIEGWNQSHGLACHNVPTIGDSVPRECDWVGYETVTPDNVRDVHYLLCHEAESHARQFSPWDMVAAEFNSAGDDLVEYLWAAYDEGVGGGIAFDISTYCDEDYGIEVSS